MAKNGQRAGFSEFLKGMGMGAADIVPGVSGGTIAFITGIYERLIRAIGTIDHRLWPLFRQEGWKAVWRRVDGRFLLLLLIGIAISIGSLARLIGTALETAPILVWSFFFGLIAASVPFVGKRVDHWGVGAVIAFIIGTGGAFWITTLPPLAATESPLFFFLAGAVAICAMVLPGISGSFILLLLGAYEAVIQAVKELELTTLAYVGLGCITGLLLFTKLLNWMFRHFQDLTIALMSGFLLGSLNKVWPWKEAPDAKESGANLLPGSYKEIHAEDPQLLWAVLLALGGAALVILLERGARES